MAQNPPKKSEYQETKELRNDFFRKDLLAAEGDQCKINTATKLFPRLYTMLSRLAYQPIDLKGRINSAAYSPDRQFIVTGSIDSISKILDINCLKNLNRSK